MIIMNGPADDGPVPEDVVYIRRDVNLLLLFDVLDRAGFDVAKRTDGLIAIQPSTASAQRSVAVETPQDTREPTFH